MKLKNISNFEFLKLIIGWVGLWTAIDSGIKTAFIPIIKAEGPWWIGVFIFSTCSCYIICKKVFFYDCVDEFIFNRKQDPTK